MMASARWRTVSRSPRRTAAYRRAKTTLPNAAITAPAHMLRRIARGSPRFTFGTIPLGRHSPGNAHTAHVKVAVNPAVRKVHQQGGNWSGAGDAGEIEVGCGGPCDRRRAA